MPDFYGSLRTEDARFSPSGRLLVLAPKQGLILLEINVESHVIRIGRHTELRSPSLEFPHGIEFLSEDLLVVANREAAVTFYRLPNADSWKDVTEIQAVLEFKSPWFGPKGASRLSEGRQVRCGPGSVRKHGDHLYICANNTNTVTKHLIVLRDGKIEIGDGELVAKTGLELIDGIAISRDGNRIAVTDSSHGRVVIYRGDDHSESCELSDSRLGYPHGICFNPSGRLLYVSDAGERLLHVFESVDGKWERSMDHSSFSLQSIDDDAFYKTKHSVGEPFRPLVGGIKGLELDPSGRFLVGTCLNQTLAFFETSPSA
jgi:hypothetical protein